MIYKQLVTIHGPWRQDPRMMSYTVGSCSWNTLKEFQVIPIPPLPSIRYLFIRSIKGRY